jgi:hypothetical protein
MIRLRLLTGLVAITIAVVNLAFFSAAAADASTYIPPLTYRYTYTRVHYTSAPYYVCYQALKANPSLRYNPIGCRYKWTERRRYYYDPLPTWNYGTSTSYAQGPYGIYGVNIWSEFKYNGSSIWELDNSCTSWGFGFSIKFLSSSTINGHTSKCVIANNGGGDPIDALIVGADYEVSALLDGFPVHSGHWTRQWVSRGGAMIKLVGG